MDGEATVYPSIPAYSIDRTSSKLAHSMPHHRAVTPPPHSSTCLAIIPLQPPDLSSREKRITTGSKCL
ncbi:Structural maintenance of chromosomes protein 4 [Dissostichus eleginoides]|uniref:Structural maintenance of chromosomes protein 4 n=1 Tax=Dissostichus eleginoides TaxID=100907 RepID=A0AAD9CQA7_DISEL|nr:Structural maintenance of chromosomes protein 4 [Dissostichus eleginoides]